MFRNATKAVWIVIAFLSATLVANAQVALVDIKTNWAKEHIEALVDQGVVAGYPDGTFRPERAVTRAEFAKMITSAFTFDPAVEAGFRDVEGHWAKEPILTLARAGIANGYPDGAFRPDEPISRAEVVSMLVRTLKLDDVRGYAASPSFTDVPVNHWAYDSVETALRLKLLPPYLRGTLAPAQAATRAETAAMIREAMRLQVVRGAIDYLNPEAQVIGVRSESGVRDITANPQTVVFRNTVVAPYENLVVGDEIYVVADRFGTPQFVKANGRVTAEDVATKVSSVTRGLLTPSDLQLILKGEWEALAESAKSKLYDMLVANGATPVEAASIMSQDWDSLQYYAKERLAQVIGEQLGVSPELAAAILDRNWEEARNLAQVQAVEELLGQFLAG